MTRMKHLSIVDGAFLHMESAEMPMHVGSLNLFEPPAGYSGEGFYEAVKAHVARRMHLAPVFTRKLALMPFDLANPVWIHDDDIDLDYHVRYMVLPRPGTLAQLETLAARLHSMLLDRSRPLWEFYVIEGLADGRIGFYGKVHHAAVDGQAGVAMATSLFDLTPEPRAVKPPREVRANTYQLGVAELLAAALQNQFQQVVQSLKLLPTLASTLTGAAREALAARRRESAEDRATRKAGKAPSPFTLAPSTPFNHSITNQRTFAAVSLPLGEIKAIGKSVGASINDVVLWLCSTALRSYLKDSRELPGKSLVAAVPISLRQEGDTTANNQVAGTMIGLGTEHADPLERLKAIKRGTSAMKRQMGTFRGVIPTDFPSLGSPWLISGLAALYGRSRIADWLRIANVTISNVPGSRVPVYLVGARMTDYYPLSIVVHGVALNITVQSHVDELCFGLIACRRAVPDLHELGEQLRKAMATLRQLAAAAAQALPAPAAIVDAIAPSAETRARAAKADTPAKKRASVARAPSERASAAKAPAARAPVARASAARAPTAPAPAARAPAVPDARAPRLRVVPPTKSAAVRAKATPGAARRKPRAATGAR
ncbi:MAG TPA: wax ester/triacylglycerol synthase family O-acyltransferase [Caldimonas sp.]|nr:wax ester/triacylglycerol synthase family O-acyltransferase [Caldimonas sp.]